MYEYHEELYILHLFVSYEYYRGRINKSELNYYLFCYILTYVFKRRFKTITAILT